MKGQGRSDILGLVRHDNPVINYSRGPIWCLVYLP